MTVNNLSMTASGRVRSGLAGMLSAALVVTAAAPVSAQTGQTGQAPETVLDSSAALEIDAAAQAQRADAISILIEIGGIISPSGEEHARAATVAEKMREIGLSDVAITRSPNVIGRIPGRSGKAIVFVSTLDDLKTVAEHQRNRQSPLRQVGGRIEGPGSNTSSTTVAILIAARALLESGLQPEHDLVFAAVAQEETGLVGMRDLFEQYKDDAIAFVDVLGDGSRLSYGALGIHWWKVNAAGPAGHTLRGGLPNVNQGIARAVDRILSLPQPERHAERMTRINISILNSGAVFNHKPAEGWFSLDIRSLDAPIIAEIENDTRKILETVEAETEIAFAMEPVNIVPGGQIPGARDSDLVRWSIAIAERLGLDPALSDAGSANLNVAIAAGTPATGLGGERGGQRGHPGEWADIDAMMRSARHVALLGYVLGNDLPAPEGAGAGD